MQPSVLRAALLLYRRPNTNTCVNRAFVYQGYKVKEIVPSPRGLVCAVSTEEKRMDCRMYVEAEVGKKVSRQRALASV